MGGSGNGPGQNMEIVRPKREPARRLVQTAVRSVLLCAFLQSAAAVPQASARDAEARGCSANATLRRAKHPRQAPSRLPPLLAHRRPHHDQVATTPP